MEHIEAQLAGGGKELEQIESEISSLHEKQSLMCDEVELLEAEIKQKYIKCDKDVVSAVQDIILSSYQQLTFSDLTYVIAQVTEYVRNYLCLYFIVLKNMIARERTIQSTHFETECINTQ